ncbi:MAG: 16S rRNA (uracil(1498)-N(3))-methyltransferase [Sphingobacteriales bacterium]|nr:MAG: 16S rRNA (uracil(1498)-N(3))-methyltransferase [Sphingobacteriales bacterium]
MALPVFFHDGNFVQGQPLWLEEDTARHVVQVLRMQLGEQLMLTDGKGNAATVSIIETAKKKCAVSVDVVVHHTPVKPVLHLAVAFTRNTARNEWLLEKATELGAATITPLQATRSERERIKPERWNNILVSAMLQSQQYYVPQLNEPTTPEQLIRYTGNIPQRLVAHCMEDKIRKPLPLACLPGLETVILIGPEGDFTPEEVAMFEENNFTAISLGKRRLRTETAAMSVCSYFNAINYEEA